MTTNTPQNPAERTGKRRADGFSGLDPTRKAAIEKRLAQVPVSMRAGYLRAVRGQASPRAAIKQHCLECCGYDRAAVRECTAAACPLFAYRPFQRSRDSERDAGNGVDFLQHAAGGPMRPPNSTHTPRSRG